MASWLMLGKSRACSGVGGSRICVFLPLSRAVRRLSTRRCSVGEWTPIGTIRASKMEPVMWIGHFMADLPVAGEAGVLPYVFVERVDETLEKVVAQGGVVVTPPYPEGNLRVATFRDPAGNVNGVWQQDGR